MIANHRASTDRRSARLEKSNASMVVPFAKPRNLFRIELDRERRALDQHFEERRIPRSQKKALLLATWNIANLGVQARSDAALALIAHVLRRFDLIAIQEVTHRYKDLAKIVALMPGYDFLMNDAGGLNHERLAFVYAQSYGGSKSLEKCNSSAEWSLEAGVARDRRGSRISKNFAHENADDGREEGGLERDHGTKLIRE